MKEQTFTHSVYTVCKVQCKYSTPTSFTVQWNYSSSSINSTSGFLLFFYFPLFLFLFCHILQFSLHSLPSVALSTIALLFSSVSFPPVSLPSFPLLCCPSHLHFPPHLSLCSVHLLHPHHFTFILKQLPPSFSFSHPSCHLFLFPFSSCSPPPPLPTFPSSCSAVSADLAAFD